MRKGKFFLRRSFCFATAAAFSIAAAMTAYADAEKDRNAVPPPPKPGAYPYQGQMAVRGNPPSQQPPPPTFIGQPLSPPIPDSANYGEGSSGPPVDLPPPPNERTLPPLPPEGVTIPPLPGSAVGQQGSAAGGSPDLIFDDSIVRGARTKSMQGINPDIQGVPVPNR